MNESMDNGAIASLKTLNEQLTCELFEVNKLLKESEAFKSHFISNVTNEILNPFSSILALSENFRNMDKTDLEQAKKMAALIYQEAFHLDFQLKNVFAAAMIEAGLDDPIPVQVNLSELVRRTIRFFSYEIERKQLEVDLTIEDLDQRLLTTFVTDELKLELVIKNLLSNAFKFSYRGGKIQVMAGIANNKFFWQIRDFGAGVPPEEYKVIFNRFKQLDQSIHSLNTGQGLGLSIVKAYLPALNGTIVLENPETGGLKVKIELPELSIPADYDDLDSFLLTGEEKF
ncbi:MAG: sensor histidine kinase [Mangrovibacterium sp.]